MATAKQKTPTPEVQEVPVVDATPTPEVQEVPTPSSGIQVTLSRGDSRKAAQEQRLGFKFTEGKKEQLSNGIVVYRH